MKFEPGAKFANSKTGARGVVLAFAFEGPPGFGVWYWVTADLTPPPLWVTPALARECEMIPRDPV